MQNAVIVHGMPSKEEYYNPNLLSMSNLHWLPWLQSQLIKKDIQADTPEIPHAFSPQWEVHCREVERFTIGQNTILVGHSCGGGFLLRYLSERKNLKVGKVILVAPWLDPDKDNTGSFFDFSIDPSLIKRTDGLTIFHSDNDMGNVIKSVAMIREALPEAEYREFHNYGHFTFNTMQTQEFPELLAACIQRALM